YVDLDLALGPVCPQERGAGFRVSANQVYSDRAATADNSCATAIAEVTRHMIHEILPVGPLQCNCSIIGDESTREAIVVDPGDDIDDILALLLRNGLKLKQIFITHAHIDHIGGAMELKAATGAPLMMHRADEMQLPMLEMQAQWVGMPLPGDVQIDQFAKDLDRVKAGHLVGTVLHTPGHTEGSSCVYFPDQQKLLAGDTLFAGSIGRTDLPGGDF